MKNILFVVAALLFLKSSGQNEEFDGKKWQAPYINFGSALNVAKNSSILLILCSVQ
jgi:hypothetical protein